MKTVGSVSKIIEGIEAEEIFRIWSDGVPLGTYINQNHFVAFMEMVEPLAIGLMMMVYLMLPLRHTTPWELQVLGLIIPSFMEQRKPHPFRNLQPCCSLVRA